MKKAFFLLFFLIWVKLSFAQAPWKVSGTITDAEDGMPLVGVTISVAGGNAGTVSDLDGKYTISVPQGKSLKFSYIGYKETIRQVKGNNAVDVTLELNSTMLDEVVAIGYGTMKKSDLTGAVASVKAEQLQKTPAAGLDQALQGRVAGVTVNANSGQPGASAEVRIRGIGTINDSRPIYVVDGAIMDNISFLSPNDIQSTEVLIDASACAIFGSSGANGVILVTTKKGKSEKGNISVNMYWGVQNRWNKLDLMQRDEFAQTWMKLNPQASTMATYQNEGFNVWMKVMNLGSSPYYPLVKTSSNPYGIDYASIETDWQDEVFKSNALIQDYYISFDGGNEKNNYAISADYFTQDGTIMGSNYERLSLRVNSAHQVRSWLKIGENLSFVNSTARNAMNNSSSAGASILSAAIAMAPWDPTHYPEGSINNRGKDLSGQISAASNFKNVTNPFSMLERSHPNDKVERWVGNVYVELTPVKNLMFRSSVSLDLANNQNRSFGDAYRYSSFDFKDKNYVTSEMIKYKTLTWENTATYIIDLGKHSFNLMAGQTVEEYNYYQMGGIGSTVLVPKETNWYLNKTTTEKSESSDGVSRTRMFSLLGRLHYSYNNRYMVTANFRADASSKFPENLWGYFPSSALAWRISEEDFMKDIADLDHLKLRLGWGQIGNDKIPPESFIHKMSEGNNVFVGYPFGVNQNLNWGAAVLSFVNNGGRWETTEQWNAGVDFGLFKGLLNGSVDAFIRDTKEMLLTVKADAPVGNRFDSWANIGTVSNKGIEVSLDHQNKMAQLNYSLGANVSFIKNELTGLNDGSPITKDRTLSNIGMPLYTFWGYEYEGVYKTDQEAAEHLYGMNDVHAGDARFKDISGADGKPDGIIDEYDKTDLGNPFPWLTYGFNIGVDYKNFDLQIFFQGVYGNKIFNGVRLRTESSGNEATLSTTMRDVYINYTDEMKQSMDKYGIDWTKLVNTNGSIPNPSGNSRNEVTSSRYIENGAYFRLKNVQLGYTIPKVMTQQVGIDRCRIYLSVSNLFTLTKYTGYDPEIGSGVDYGNYPQSRTLMLGLNLNF